MASSSDSEPASAMSSSTTAARGWLVAAGAPWSLTPSVSARPREPRKRGRGMMPSAKSLDARRARAAPPPPSRSLARSSYSAANTAPRSANTAPSASCSACPGVVVPLLLTSGVLVPLAPRELRPPLRVLPIEARHARRSAIMLSRCTSSSSARSSRVLLRLRRPASLSSEAWGGTAARLSSSSAAAPAATSAAEGIRAPTCSAAAATLGCGDRASSVMIAGMRRAARRVCRLSGLAPR
mmetsp:Transcript_37349/g.94720  ORF Transcript_37349/g.94720 Transcript_37349/m.94720 type:complete len:239 (-) Transcript_37349:407-1123(-)